MNKILNSNAEEISKNNKDKYCICRVSLKNKNRCKNLKRDNTLYCRKHQKESCYILYGNYNQDDDIFERLKNINEKNFSPFFLKDLKKNELEYLIKINEAYMENNLLKKIIERRQTFEIITNNRFFKKEELKDIIKKYFRIKKNYNYYKNKINEIMKCQAIIRGCLFRKMLGPCILNITKSINSDDVDGTTFWEEKNGKKVKSNEITKEYQRTIFSFKEKNTIYSFSLRTMRKLMESTKKNPYTGIKFSSNIKSMYRKRMEFMREMNYKIVPKNIIEEELKYMNQEEQELWNKVFEVFHNINLLGYYIDEDWFLNLNVNELKKLYYVMKTIWVNYDVDFEEVLKIVPDYLYLLHRRQSSINRRYNNHNKKDLQKLLIDQIERLTMGGINDEYKRIGCWIFLKSLKEVSREASRYIPY